MIFTVVLNEKVLEGYPELPNATFKNKLPIYSG